MKCYSRDETYCMSVRQSAHFLREPNLCKDWFYRVLSIFWFPTLSHFHNPSLIAFLLLCFHHWTFLLFPEFNLCVDWISIDMFLSETKSNVNRFIVYLPRACIRALSTLAFSVFIDASLWSSLLEFISYES